jgi:hypothetical protein
MRRRDRIINIALGVAGLLTFVVMAATFGPTDPSMRIQAGTILGALWGVLFTRLWFLAPRRNTGPHRPSYY